MLAKLGSLPVDEERYAYEIKWDGVRALAHASGGALSLVSRSGRDMTARFPELAGLGEALDGGGGVLDGEIVAFDASGRPSFQHLQGRIHLSGEAEVRSRVARAPVTLVLFDVLELGGSSLLELPYEERRAALEGLELSGDRWQTPGSHSGEGAALLEASRRRGLEGIVAKRLGSRYEPGRRSGAWIKVKNTRSQEVVIGGWLPGRGRRSATLGALLAGVYEQGMGERALRYAGKVGTGFSDETLRRLVELLAPLRRPTSPFSGRLPQRGAIFVEPRLVAEVDFSEWTRDGTMRHPAFKGLREDRAPEDVVRE